MAVTAIQDNSDETESNCFSKEAYEKCILKIDFTVLNCQHLKLFK